MKFHLFRLMNLSQFGGTMQKLVSFWTISLCMLLFGSAVHAFTPLVEAEWVKGQIGKKGIVMLDLRTLSSYQKGHVPGSIFTNYSKDGWRTKNSEGTVGMLPPVEQISSLIGGLGIDNEDHVVLIPFGTSSSKMGTATRVYWTFKVLGHDKVSILNGGMAAYKKAKKPKYPLETESRSPQQKTFNARLKKEWVLSKDEVKQAFDNGQLFVDSRTDDQYVGLNRHPKAKATGTIPGSRNVPQDWLTIDGKGTFRNIPALQQIMKSQGVPDQGSVIAFCNTGHWSTLDWFVMSELLGNKDARMYDGSMLEWTAAGMPMEVKIKQ
ncbi:MAG: sulfurtransferase [Deltaproteobacteria bacterium]|nr:sulfurtransferase [Deltaproteobacteria bacterium]